MNKTVIIVILFLLAANFLNAGVSGKQNRNNIMYLEKLDDNILSTIEMLTTFNDAANNMQNDIDGLNRFKSFLMEMTIECSKLRNSIRNSIDMDRNDREKQIMLMIESIKPDVSIAAGEIKKMKDKKNKKYLSILSDKLSHRSGQLMKKIVRAEKDIIQKRKIPEIHLNYHSRLFFNNLLQDFIEINELLSSKNRELLSEIVHSVEDYLIEN